MLPDLDKLYEPYSADASLSISLMYWKKEAEKLGLSPDVRDVAISETFLEMANGKKFPIGTCDCGCEFPIKWSCVALNHYVLKKMIAIKDEVDKKVADILKANIHTQMLTLISAENQKFIDENSKPRRSEGILYWLGF